MDSLYIKFKIPKRVRKPKRAKKINNVMSSGNLTPKKFEKFWWSELNGKCVKCSGKCKQSSFAMIFCPSYSKGV